jgi:hypothetical protein
MKNYIPDFEDNTDFIIIKGYRDARDEQKFKIGKL